MPYTIFGQPRIVNLFPARASAPATPHGRPGRHRNFVHHDPGLTPTAAPARAHFTYQSDAPVLMSRISALALQGHNKSAQGIALGSFSVRAILTTDRVQRLVRHFAGPAPGLEFWTQRTTDNGKFRILFVAFLENILSSPDSTSVSTPTYMLVIRYDSRPFRPRWVRSYNFRCSRRSLTPRFRYAREIFSAEQPDFRNLTGLRPPAARAVRVLSELATGKSEMATSHPPA